MYWNNQRPLQPRGGLHPPLLYQVSLKFYYENYEFKKLFFSFHGRLYKNNWFDIVCFQASQGREMNVLYIIKKPYHFISFFGITVSAARKQLF